MQRAMHTLPSVRMFKGFRLQVGSLRQLTLLSFVVALIPLAILLWHSQTSLTRVSTIAASEAQFAVGLTRTMGDVENLSIDLERLIRQYHVLEKKTLWDLIENYFVRMDLLVNEVCEPIEQQLHCLAISERTDWFKANQQIEDEMLLDAHLAEFRQSLQSLRQQVDSLLDSRIREQQTFVSDVQKTQTRFIVIILGLSFLLVIFASQLILTPVEKVEKVIRAIARQDEKLPDVSTSGPTELIELEMKLHWLADRLNQLEHLRHALLRHASHELKTPLASIKEGCSLLTEQVVGELNEQQGEVVSLLNSSTQRLNMLIEQLLDYNLLLQQAKPAYQTVQVQQLVDALIEENSLAIGQNNHQVLMELDVSDIYVDPNLFRRILDNLLSNALAHGTVGRPINIKLYEENDRLILDVANRGAKIPEEMRDVLFEPFKRGDNRRNDRVLGSGLGLSIVADCARMMHGSAKIVDVGYADVCIRVTLPSNGEPL